MSTSLSLRQIADVLGGEIVNNRNGGQSVLCPGPGHSRHDRSLSVMIGDNNDIVVNSFAKDDPIKCKDFVRERIGRPAWQPNGAGLPDPIANMEARAAAKERKTLVAEYVYRTKDGQPYLKVAKLVGEISGKKDFPQYHWNGNSWINGKPSGPKIPYRLPELLAAVRDTVFICEGEKDADALTEQGFVATTASEGAGSWTPDLNEHFAGKAFSSSPTMMSRAVSMHSRLRRAFTALLVMSGLSSYPAFPTKVTRLIQIIRWREASNKLGTGQD